MSKSEIEQSPSKTDALVEALEMEGATLTDSISSQDLEQLTDIQAELADIDNDEEMEEIETQETTDNASSKQNESEPDLDNNVVEVEIETEGERVEAPEEVVPEIKEKRPIVKKEVISPTQIPIKPLTIAPKPTTITAQKLGTKTAVVSSGQQIVLIQSPGGTANAMTLGSGQQIKLVSPSGQTLTLPQLQAMGQQLIKTADGNLVLKTGVQKLNTNANQTIKTTTATKRFITSAQPKKIIVGAQGQAQSIKIVTSSAGTSILNSPTKTISLAQAQQMGLITTSQLQQILPQSPAKQIIVSKAQPKTQVFKVGTSAFTKSPTKILPAPKLIHKTGQQKVVIRPSTQLKTGVNSNQQLLRIPSGQLASTTGQIHQINVPGRGIQYVRLVSATSAPTSTTASSISTTSGTTQTLRVMSAQSQSKLQTIVPVALVNSSRQNQSGNTMPTNIIKVIPVSGTNQSVTQTVRTVAAKSGTTQTQRIFVPASSAQVVPTQIVQLQSQNQSAAVQKVQPKSTTVNSKVAINLKPFIKQERVSSPEDSPEYVSSSQNRSSLEPNGLRPRKPCNCTKSQCLKLYCDCFANGEFCHMCNCVNCFNNLDFEEERQKAIKSCLERNPNAFRPKIGKGRDSGETVRKHTKGCNCKRSGCLKNYCECYEAKIACSSNCKCVGCRNIEDSMEKKSLRPLAPALSAVLDDPSMSSLLASMTKVSSSMSVKVAIPSLSKNRIQHGLSQQHTVSNFRPMLGDSTAKQAFKFMTDEVIEAICQCLLARADEAERNMLSAQEAERQVLEEFGRCLIEIIAISSSADNT